LGFRVGLGDQGARLAPPEAQVPENALTLPHAQVNRIRFVQVVGQELAVPEVLAVAIVPGRLAQRSFQLRPLVGSKARGSAGTLLVLQGPKATFVKAMHPPLNGYWIFAKIPRYLVATQPMADQQYAVQTVIIARL
jgi:hypothetical protein